jgi:3D (Asp-Asp-Asp) domain-containing protein
MKVIAVSRDLLSMYGLRNGTKVRIEGLPGIYHVRDKMNKRYRKRIDIYMGLDRHKALRWGRRSVKIYWD